MVDFAKGPWRKGIFSEIQYVEEDRVESSIGNHTQHFRLIRIFRGPPNAARQPPPKKPSSLRVFVLNPRRAPSPIVFLSVIFRVIPWLTPARHPLP